MKYNIVTANPAVCVLALYITDISYRIKQRRKEEIMCGIIGFTGNINAKEVLLQGLKALEYRGYDSAGISFLQKTELRQLKQLEKLQGLLTKYLHLLMKLLNVVLAIQDGLHMEVFLKLTATLTVMAK